MPHLFPRQPLSGQCHHYFPPCGDRAGGDTLSAKSAALDDYRCKPLVAVLPMQPTQCELVAKNTLQVGKDQQYPPTSVLFQRNWMAAINRGQSKRECNDVNFEPMTRAARSQSASLGRIVKHIT